MYRLFLCAFISAISAFFILTSCGSGSEQAQFCKCMQKGEELDRLSHEILKKEVVDARKADEMRELTAEQKEACKDFQTMGGDKMRELQSHCH